MSKSARPRAEDLRSLFRFVNECRDLGDDPAAWRRHLLAGLARLTGAVLVTTYEGVWKPYRLTGLIEWNGGGIDARLSDRIKEELVLRGTDFIPLFHPYLDAFDRGVGPSLTRADLVPDRIWYRSPFFRDFHGPSGGDALLYCSQLLPDGSGLMRSLVLVGALGDRDFRARDRALILEAHRAVTPWVGGALAGLDEPSPADLPPRLRQVLRCLLEGDSDKQIVARLGLSRYTVNEYVERVFRHFGAQSRPELLARWVRRGAGGRFPWAASEFEPR